MTADVRTVQIADVYKSARLAGTLRRHNGGTEFRYIDSYDGPAVATTLPVSDIPVFTPAGAVPAFFAGLLPEGRRFTSLQRSIKTSADDELSLLLAVGSDTIGNVVIVPHQSAVIPASPALVVKKDFSDVRFAELMADAGIFDAVGLPGVQEKVSARVISLPITTPSDRFILKLNPPEFPFVVENEAFFLNLARQSRMPVVNATLVHDCEGAAGLLVRRFDRSTNGTNDPTAIACEDACQILNRWPGDKYNVTSEELIDQVSRLCASPMVAARDIFRQLLFAWITGNGDVHAKNISLLEHGDSEWRVSPAYDLPSTLFYDDFTMALAIGGRTSGLSRRRWLEFASEIGLAQKAADRVLSDFLKSTQHLAEQIREGALPFSQKVSKDAARNITNRRNQLLA